MRKQIISKAVVTALVISLSSSPACVFAESGSEAKEPSVKAESSSSAEALEYVPGEVIVSFAKNTSEKKEETIIKNAIEAIDDEPKDDVSAHDLEEPQITSIDSDTVLLETEQETDTEELVEELQDNPSVKTVQPNYYYTVDSSSNAPFESGSSRYNSWYMDYLDVPEAWSAIEKYKKDGTIKNPSKRVVIATLDSGIYLNHEDESDIRKGGNFDLAHCKTTVFGIDPDSAAYNPSKGSITEYPNPNISHGNSTSSVIGATSGNGKGIAGIAAGKSNNIASVMAINVFRRYINSEHKATSADIIAGIDYACRHNAKVIMMCLGHSPGGPDGNGGKINDKALEKKINWATREKDVVFVASAGNSNNTSTWYPSDFDACISVINTVRYKDIDSKNCKASSSNYGSKKDISAPGTGIMHCTMSRSGYKEGTGTSYAAPIVASVAGLVRYVNPSLNQQEVKDILYSTATDLYAPGYDIYTGYGNVDAYAAVTAAAGMPDKIGAAPLTTPKVWVKSAGTNSARITWSNVGAYKYHIYRSTNPNSGFKYVKTSTGTSWTDTGLAFNKPYYYKVVPRGTSEDGKRIDGKASKAVLGRAICATPTLSVTAKNKTKARARWTRIKGVTGYQLFISTNSSTRYKYYGTKSGTNLTVSGLKSKRTYYYKVRPYVIKNGKRYYGDFSPIKACRQR